MTSEERIQSECFQWFWNTYPNLRGLLCYNLNNSRDARQGSRNKQLGLIAGRADMVLYYQGNTFMFEFKTISGRQSPEQKNWESLVKSHGFTYDLIRSTAQFKDTIHMIFFGSAGIGEQQ